MGIYRKKIEFVYLPRRLAVKDVDGFRFVGWVWMQKALLVQNLNHGWIAFVEDQTDEKLETCPCCKNPINLKGYQNDQTTNA